jgi:hypothetical protein
MAGAATTKAKRPSGTAVLQVNNRPSQPKVPSKGSGCYVALRVCRGLAVCMSNKGRPGAAANIMQQHATLSRVLGALIWLNQAVLALERHFYATFKIARHLVTLGDPPAAPYRRYTFPVNAAVSGQTPSSAPPPPGGRVAFLAKRDRGMIKPTVEERSKFLSVSPMCLVTTPKRPTRMRPAGLLAAVSRPPTSSPYQALRCREGVHARSCSGRRAFDRDDIRSYSVFWQGVTCALTEYNTLLYRLGCAECRVISGPLDLEIESVASIQPRGGSTRVLEPNQRVRGGLEALHSVAYPKGRAGR